MKLNENILIEGKTVVLVPYKSDHVEKYHSWMQSPELQTLTASEPLTLKEEYEMQQSWWLDEDKCTFIVLDKSQWQNPPINEIDSMCGDVNLFFNDQDDKSVAEIEIMIAEPNCRGKGLGKEALLLMMKYGVQELKVTKFTAKIGCQNTRSLGMFKKIGFVEESVSEVFQEVTLELPITPSTLQWLMDATSDTTMKTYSDECKLKPN
ncbi:N-acetyltransferase 9-like protein [Glandiceps talaboti]